MPACHAGTDSTLPGPILASILFPKIGTSSVDATSDVAAFARTAVDLMSCAECVSVELNRFAVTVPDGKSGAGFDVAGVAIGTPAPSGHIMTRHTNDRHSDAAYLRQRTGAVCVLDVYGSCAVQNHASLPLFCRAPARQHLAVTSFRLHSASVAAVASPCSVPMCSGLDEQSH